MAYQDFSSYHILSESSVDDLNKHINDSSKSVSVDFFRPNIVVSGVSAYDEVKLTIGSFSAVMLFKKSRLKFVGGLVIQDLKPICNYLS